MIQKTGHPIRGVIFDLDGTLYKMKWFMKPLLTVMLFPRMVRLPRYMAVRKSFAGKEMADGDDLLRAMAATLAQTTNAHTRDAMLAWIHDVFYPAFERVMPTMRGSRPGLNDTLSILREKGMKTAILSDFARIDERLRGLRIPGSLFDTLASTESDGALKPSPRSLLRIAESWAVDPRAILIIGDRDDTDGIAAANAGMHFLRISDKKRPPVDAHDWPSIKTFLVNHVTR